MSEIQPKAQSKVQSEAQSQNDKTVKQKKTKKLYRCSECTNSVTLTIVADVVCTRCNVPMRLFEAEQSGLFITESESSS